MVANSTDKIESHMARIKARLVLPVIAAPMFLVSGPELVIAACKAGVIGSFPTLNARPIEVLEDWFQRIVRELELFKAAGGNPAPWAANLIVHRSNARADQDVALTLKYRPEIVITALGTPAGVVAAVHDYGGLVFADVNSVAYARKAAAAGADGLVLVASGAGGHTGPLNAFSFVPAVREFFDGPIILGGGIINGRGVRAAQMLGADFAYIGTRFIATMESMAPQAYKQMLVDCTEEDIICSSHFTGVAANYLKPSIIKAGIDPAQLGVRKEMKFDHRGDSAEAKAWKDIWAAGQGVRAITSVLSTADLVDELARDYAAAAPPV